MSTVTTNEVRPITPITRARSIRKMYTPKDIADACETIQIWRDETDESKYIVSRGINGVEPPYTIGVYTTYDEATARAQRVALRDGLDIVDEVAA